MPVILPATKEAKGMFKTYKKLSAEIKTLREEVFGQGEEPTSRMSYMEMFYGMSFGYTSRRSLREEVKSLEKTVEKYQKLTDLLLAHFKLEYVKLTEENGSKKVQEVLRKKKSLVSKICG